MYGNTGEPLPSPLLLRQEHISCRGAQLFQKLAAIRHMNFPVDALHGGSHGGRLDPQPCGGLRRGHPHRIGAGYLQLAGSQEAGGQTIPDATVTIRARPTRKRVRARGNGKGIPRSDLLWHGPRASQVTRTKSSKNEHRKGDEDLVWPRAELTERHHTCEEAPRCQTEAQTHQRRCAALPLPAALARLSSQDTLLTGRLCARPSLSHAPATGTDRDNLSNHRHHQDTQFRGNQKGCAVGDPPRRLEDLVAEVAGDKPRRHPASKRKTPTGVHVAR